MNSKIAGMGLATVVLAGTLAGVAGPAHAAAAPTKCALGSWQLDNENSKGNGVYQGVKWNETIKGAAGAKLTVTKTRALYDFSRSKREFVNGVHGRTRYAQWTQNRGTLRLTATVTGDKTGSFATKPKGARGDATGRTVLTAPRHKDLGKYNIAAQLRRGNEDTLVPDKATFTCSATKLVLTRKKTVRHEDGWVKTVRVLTYRRI